MHPLRCLRPLTGAVRVGKSALTALVKVGPAHRLHNTYRTWHLLRMGRAGSLCHMEVQELIHPSPLEGQRLSADIGVKNTFSS